MNSIPTLSDSPKAVFTDTTSGPWSTMTGPDSRAVQKPPRGYLRPFGIGLIIALSPITAVADPWVSEPRRQTQPTAFVLIHSIGRRRITRAEALRLAQEILERAERERLRSADWEAARGAAWGEEQ